LHFAAFNVVADPCAVGTAHDGNPLNHGTVIFAGLDGGIEIAHGDAEIQTVFVFRDAGALEMTTETLDRSVCP
jgi:hypothetical protein